MDPGEPYSCTQWGNMPNGGSSQMVEDTGYDIWTLFESQSATPSTVFITHEMQVYDMMNAAGSWSIGSRIDQMLEDCGSLCEEDGGCTTSAGDVNEDAMLNIQDLITMVNHILGSSPLMDCALEAADINVDGTVNIQDLITMVNHILGSSPLMDCALEAADINVDGVVNIQDLISLVNAILGSARSAELNGTAKIEYLTSDEDMIIQIKSDIDIAGLQISLINDSQLDIEIKDNSHINQESNFVGGMNRYLAYSIFNQPFDSRMTEILVHSGASLEMDDFQLTVADINGDPLNLSHSQMGKTYQTGPHRFELAELYPNPFNPSTQISFSLPMDDFVKLTAYDVRGNVVDAIFEGAQGVGQHSYTWNAANLPSGVYYIRLQAGELVTSQKALLIK